MAENASSPTEPLDVRSIRYLVRLMKRYDLTALDVRDGARQIRLRRQGHETAAPFAFGHAPAAPGAFASPSAPAAPPARTEAALPSASQPTKTIVIESPMVGTYYSASAPDAPPFVSPGSVVHPDTIVCIIEAMKVYNDIQADCAGVVAEVCVNNGDFVEFNTVLFRVDPG